MTPPSFEELSANLSVMSSAMSEFWKSMSGLTLPLPAMMKLQSDYVSQASALWNETLSHMNGQGSGSGNGRSNGHAGPIGGDRRFAGEDWAASPAAAYTAQAYLLNARTLMQMAELLEGDEKMKARVRFGIQQWIDATSPSNFLALNPEAQRKAIETHGRSLSQGLQMLLKDVRQGHVSQTDESVFEVGRNVATTEGAVVFENELFQLLEYRPLTEQVYERPLLFVPPCINKFYILDLQPHNSLIRYAVEQGHRTFLISWRNPDASMAGKTWDDYVAHGPIEAIRVVREIAQAKTIDALGFCVGGTILSTALAVLAARGEHPAASLTLLTTFLDFEETGIMDVFIDETLVKMREMSIGGQSAKGPGLLKGRDLANTFSFLRPNDLVWNYVVANYLKGEAPPPFDLLYWNADSANLPGAMYAWYLRNTYLENNLIKPGRLTICGESIDLGAIKAPAYIYGSHEDHIVPWEGAYRSTRVLTGKLRFVLGASGHIAGVINPPAKKKRSYWTYNRLPAAADQWLDKATEHPGSWWTDWADWLKSHAGKLIAAPKAPGSREHKPIEPAPGRYVKAKA